MAARQVSFGGKRTHTAHCGVWHAAAPTPKGLVLHQVVAVGVSVALLYLFPKVKLDALKVSKS